MLRADIHRSPLRPDVDCSAATWADFVEPITHELAIDGGPAGMRFHLDRNVAQHSCGSGS
jgi:hypothetical protein